MICSPPVWNGGSGHGADSMAARDELVVVVAGRYARSSRLPHAVAFCVLPPRAALQHEGPLIRTELQQPGKSRPDTQGHNLAGFMHDQVQIIMLVSKSAEPRSSDIWRNAGWASHSMSGPMRPAGLA